MLLLLLLSRTCGHSDNSLTESNTRRSYRHYTCILYCNDGWNKADGGALRLYPHRGLALQPNDAKATCVFHDILPINGRLLIFDSTLVHSVEPVKAENGKRRALTLWIFRPEKSGAQGETWCEGSL